MSLDGFDAKTGEAIEPDKLEQDFERFYHNVLPHLPEALGRKLLTRIGTLDLVPHAGGDVVYGANYDITAEVEGLIRAVRAMQNSVMHEDGKIRADVTPREMKEVVTSTTSLMNLLMKAHAQLMTFDRQRAVEQSTVDVLREMGGEEIVENFVKMMEERLERAE